jgi:hypothetical protein
MKSPTRRFFAARSDRIEGMNENVDQMPLPVRLLCLALVVSSVALAITQGAPVALKVAGPPCLLAILCIWLKGDAMPTPFGIFVWLAMVAAYIHLVFF